MREFLLNIEVDVAAISGKLNLVFLVSDSSQAPSWNSVNSNKASLRRSFTSSSNSRNVYFSLTSLFNGLTGATVVDLSTGAEKDNIDRQVPGLMAANTSYYVHAYQDNGAFIKTSAAITTRGYPTSYPAASNTSDDPRNYTWGMWDKDRGTSSSPIVFPTIEINDAELHLFPFRLILPTTAIQACIFAPSLLRFQSVDDEGLKNTMLHLEFSDLSSFVSSAKRNFLCRCNVWNR